MSLTTVEEVSGSQEDVSRYLHEIRQYPRLTPDEEKEIARRCANGDPDAMRIMVNSNLRLVVSVAIALLMNEIASRVKTRLYQNGISQNDGCFLGSKEEFKVFKSVPITAKNTFVNPVVFECQDNTRHRQIIEHKQQNHSRQSHQAQCSIFCKCLEGFSCPTRFCSFTVFQNNSPSSFLPGSGLFVIMLTYYHYVILPGNSKIHNLVFKSVLGGSDIRAAMPLPSFYGMIAKNPLHHRQQVIFSSLHPSNQDQGMMFPSRLRPSTCKPDFSPRLTQI